jgi:hypothetical protein
MNRTDRVLNLLKDGRKWKKPEIAKALGCTDSQAHTALNVLRNALAILPGPRTNGFSDYTITAVGRERLAGKQRKTHTKKSGYIPIPQTTSRFAIENRHVLHSVWGVAA